MSRQITMTFGNDFILNKLRKKHPSVKLDVFLGNSNQYQIVDFSGVTNIFQNPLIFNIDYSKDFTDEFYFVNYTYFNLDDDQKKIFDAYIKKIQETYKDDKIISFSILHEAVGKKRTILMTTWNNYLDFKHWNLADSLMSLSEMSLNYKRI